MVKSDIGKIYGGYRLDRIVRGNYVFSCVKCEDLLFVTPHNEKRVKLIKKGLLFHAPCKEFTTDISASKDVTKQTKIHNWYDEILYAYKYGAKTRGFVFSLTDKEFIKLITGNCYYCDSAPSNTSKYYKVKYNGIDRVNNKEGYSKRNVVSCCALCNRMKSTLTQDEFIDHIIKIHKRFNNG